jgi:hypothetical protein
MTPYVIARAIFALSGSRVRAEAVVEALPEAISIEVGKRIEKIFLLFEDCFVAPQRHS